MLNYQVHNKNPNFNWIVFVHGIGGSVLTWKKQISDFAARYNLLLIDLPGHGGSQLEGFKKINVEKLNQGIKNVLDCLGIVRAHFVGVSMGSMVVAHFATAFPKRVMSIVFGGAAIKVNGIYRGLMTLAQWVKNILPARVLFNIFAVVILPKKNHKTSRKIFIRESLKMKRKSFLAWVDYLKETLHPDDLIEKLDKSRIKILFVSGDEDRCFISGAKKAAQKIKHSSFKIIKRCGHVCTIEKCKEFNDLALNFLASSPIQRGVA